MTFPVFTGPMWSWRLALEYWWLFFCFTSSSPVATHPKRSYSLVINPTMCISQLTCWCISQYHDHIQRLFTAMHCSWADSDIHKKLNRILLSPCQSENRNFFACDFTWYVKSCLDWLGSEQSSDRLFWSITAPDLLQARGCHSTYCCSYSSSTLKTESLHSLCLCMNTIETHDSLTQNDFRLMVWI